MNPPLPVVVFVLSAFFFLTPSQKGNHPIRAPPPPWYRFVLLPEVPFCLFFFPALPVFNPEHFSPRMWKSLFFFVHVRLPCWGGCLGGWGGLAPSKPLLLTPPAFGSFGQPFCFPSVFTNRHLLPFFFFRVWSPFSPPGFPFGRGRNSFLPSFFFSFGLFSVAPFLNTCHPYFFFSFSLLSFSAPGFFFVPGLAF